MNQQLQNILHLIIIAVILILFYAFYPKTTYSPHGIYLPQTTQTYSSIPASAVEMINVPPNAQPIGLINTQMHFQSTNQTELESDADQSVAYAKKLAAKYGANAIGPVQIARTPNQGILDAIQIQAYAYRLNY
ncbi:MAG: hypothetical protein EP298_03825 [Gammaproteobacteria bacterium]|nr:MAG: hypothetical protein EP298_03825 [Gammaproteobacteria bacterium]UTW43759.1 hypothetical protein KFE69_06630 [bacterium SCSIO 12844]